MSASKPSGSKPATNHLLWIARLWNEKRALIAGLFLLTLLSSAVAVTYPYLAKRLLDTIQALVEKPGDTPPMATVDRLLMVFLAVGLGGLVASIAPGIRGGANSKFEHSIRSVYWRKVLAKDYKFFSSFSSGDIVTRLTDDLYDFPKLSWFLCSGIFRAVESISKIVFCLVAMVALDWRLTLFSIIPLPVMIILFYLTQDRIYDSFQKNQQAISAINTRLEMSFSGVRIIKAYACESKYRRFFTDVLDTRWKTEMGVARLEIVLRMIYQYIDYVAQVGIVFAGGLMAVRGVISIGTFYAFYTYLTMLIYPILDIPQLFVSAKRAFVNIDRLEEMAGFPEPGKSGSSTAIGGIETVELRGVSFRYPGSAVNSLDNVGLHLRKGERLAVIGPVGSGKSTLMKVILGILPPIEGSVAINGIDLRETDKASFLKKLAYVPQEALLFSGTLRENVDFGTDEPDDASFDTAMEIAQMKEELRAFSEGESTVVGQRGVSLSGGQKQRMAIARALVRRPELLLFDDITASLDAANEERLMRQLKEFSAGIGFIIVSHRLSTLQYVDKVLYLDGGSVRGAGTHDELMEQAWYRSFIEQHMGTKTSQ